MNDNNFYTVKDVLKKAGITRPTLYKWLREGKIPEVMRDRNNFRLFTKKDIEKILAYKNLIRKPLKKMLLNSFNDKKKEMHAAKKDIIEHNKFKEVLQKSKYVAR